MSLRASHPPARSPFPTRKTGHRLQLRDGRRLGYLDYGDPQGLPVLLFHGLPGSRLQGHPDRSIATSSGIRLIGVDRPGFGLSDYQAGRTLLDWPDDVEALANHLGLARFAVLGISGGGPYAAACAWKIPNRLTVAALVSGVGPLDDETLNSMPLHNRTLLLLARKGQWLLRPPGAVLAYFARQWPDKYLSTMNAHLPPADKVIFTCPEVQAMIKEDMAEAFRQGSRAAVRDIVLLTRPWGFPLRDISVPVQLWHGEQDTTVPVKMGRDLAASIPLSQAHFVRNAGHFLFIDRWRQILTDLLR